MYDDSWIGCQIKGNNLEISTIIFILTSLHKVKQKLMKSYYAAGFFEILYDLYGDNQIGSQMKGNYI